MSEALDQSGESEPTPKKAQSTFKRPAAPKRRPLAKQKWTIEEEVALKDGVSKYGIGKWRQIQQDSEFGQALARRSNVDLKDKWRNLQMDSQAAQAGAGGGISERKKRKRSRESPFRDQPEEEVDTMHGPQRRQPARRASRRVFGVEFSEGEQYEADLPRHADDAVTQDSESQSIESDAEDSAQSHGSDTSTFSTNLTQAAILILQTAQKRPVSLVMVIEWLKKALHRQTVNEPAVARKLQSLESHNRITCNGGAYQLEGFTGEVAQTAAQYVFGEGNDDMDPFRNAHGDVAERALTMMQMIKEAESAEKYADQLRKSADRIMDARRLAQAAMDGEVEGPFRMPSGEAEAKGQGDQNEEQAIPNALHLHPLYDAEESNSSRSQAEALLPSNPNPDGGDVMKFGLM